MELGRKPAPSPPKKIPASFRDPLRMALRLRALMPRGRRLKWTLALLILGPPLLFGLLFLVGSALDLQVQLDVTSALLAVAAVVLALTVFHVTRHVLRPKQTVSVGYHYKLEQPAVPVVGRYSFRLEVFYELEEKGERSRVEQGTIELKFKKGDHPEMLAWCCGQIAQHLHKHRHFARERFPEARILLPPDPTPRRIARELYRDDDER